MEEIMQIGAVVQFIFKERISALAAPATNNEYAKLMEMVFLKIVPAEIGVRNFVLEKSAYKMNNAQGSRSKNEST